MATTWASMGVSTPKDNSPVYTYGVDERRDIDVSRDIARLLPNASPFTVILMRAKKESTKTAEFKWWDEEPGGWWTKINNASNYGTDDETLLVDDASIFRAKDVVKVPRTGEVMLVVSTSESEGANSITVSRGYGTTAAAAILDDDWIMRMGNAMEEFSNAPETKINHPVKNYNYTQIFRTPFDQSMTSEAEAVVTSEKERTRLRKTKAIDHRLDIERALLFGERKEDTTNKRRMTGGLLSFVKDNVYDMAGTTTEAKFEEACEMAFTNGSDRKLLVCSYAFGSVINSFAKDKIETRSGEETYGIRMKTYKSFHGDLYIVPSRAFEKAYKGLGFIVDMEYVKYRPLQGRDTVLKQNIQDNDADGWMDEYFTEAGLQVRLGKVHARIENAVS